MSATSAVAPAAGRSRLGANLVLLAGVGLVGYGLMFLVRNFTGFIELGLTPAHVGGTPEEIRAFSGHLYNYISHLQVAVAGFIIALGVAVIALAFILLGRSLSPEEERKPSHFASLEAVAAVLADRQRTHFGAQFSPSRAAHATQPFHEEGGASEAGSTGSPFTMTTSG